MGRRSRSNSDPQTGISLKRQIGNRRFGSLFKQRNRGLLLDLFVFILNLFVMRMLGRNFLDMVRAAADDDAFAKSSLFIFAISLLVLPPAGAVLKRWHFHQRLKDREYKEGALAGCLFNPIFYISLMFLIFATANAFVLQHFSEGGFADPGPGIFVSSIFVGIALVIVHTWLVYRYFSPPKKAPTSPFLLSPASDLVGDICIFVNMIFMQIIWNTLAAFDLPHPADVTEFVGRLFVLCFIGLLVYFPPRILYLAEDIEKRRTWLIILLANSPVILRVLIGTYSVHPMADW